MTRPVGLVVLCCAALVALLAMAGCSGTGSAGKGSGSAVATATKGANMAGPRIDVHVSAAAVASKPVPWVLTNPRAAVASYLAWTTYAFRIATSSVATPTMGGKEGVRVDSYIQYNLEKARLIDQKLLSIAFGTPSIVGTHTLVPTKEQWTYSYLSVTTVDKTLAGPYSASYDATYTVVKAKNGNWVVDSVKATALGPVK